MSDTTETTEIEDRPDHPIGRVLFRCSYLIALAGGFLMVAIAAMVVVSVLGRWLISKPIFGDFEMVAMGTAIAVTLFLPYCHLKRGNVIVDLFMSWAPRRVQSFLDVIGSLILAAISGMLTWRMYLGGFDVHKFGDTTYILALPLWWAFPFMILAYALLTLNCIYTAVQDLVRTFR
ncbi:MAG: TRAP transporter small permease [Proteobacteria bacterium]|nr:TRAP transporter small permease [Pseudomonadota bacterium]